MNGFAANGGLKEVDDDEDDIMSGVLKRLDQAGSELQRRAFEARPDEAGSDEEGSDEEQWSNLKSSKGLRLGSDKEGSDDDISTMEVSTTAVAATAVAATEGSGHTGDSFGLERLIEQLGNLELYGNDYREFELEKTCITDWELKLRKKRKIEGTEDVDLERELANARMEAEVEELKERLKKGLKKELKKAVRERRRVRHMREVERQMREVEARKIARIESKLQSVLSAYRLSKEEDVPERAPFWDAQMAEARKRFVVLNQIFPTE